MAWAHTRISIAVSLVIEYDLLWYIKEMYEHIVQQYKMLHYY